MWPSWRPYESGEGPVIGQIIDLRLGTHQQFCGWADGERRSGLLPCGHAYDSAARDTPTRITSAPARWRGPLAERRYQPPGRSVGVTTRAEGAAATRSRILDAVFAVVAEGNVHDASMEAIAARAGVTRVTLYRTFGSKQDLLEGFVLHALAEARLDRVDAAHTHPDVRTAVRHVLRANCQMFARLAGAMPFALELARSDAEMRAFMDATYHGRRHRAMGARASRVVQEGAARPGWTKARIADSLLILSSFEAFETLVGHRGRSVDGAAASLFRLAGAFLSDG